ncbi:taste receptor type 1 member 3 [Lissotriton helveticus]
MRSLAYLLCLNFLGSTASGNFCSTSLFQADGHYMVGGLFSFGTSTVGDIAGRSKPELLECGSFYDMGFVFALAMRFAIEEINNSTSLLPGVRLGYEIYDTCFEPLVAMQPTMLFLTRQNSTGVDVNCNYTDYNTRVIAVVGPMTSAMSMTMGKLFSFFKVPQVSYAASRNDLSDRELFPSFFRTIPSDKIQIEAMVEVIRFFRWNWVAAIGSDDEYGHGGLELFSSLTSGRDICTAFENTIPTNGNDPAAKETFAETVKQINNSQANVILLFADEVSARPLLAEWVRLGLGPKVWMASDGWATSPLIMSLPGVLNIGTILGFTVQGRQIPGFDDHVLKVFKAAPMESLCWTSRDGFFPSAEPSTLQTYQCQDCDYISFDNISSALKSNYTYSTYAAVYSIAHSLHNLLKCNSGACLEIPNITAWQLLEEVRRVQFRLNNLSFHYDDFGNLNTGYNVLLWHERNSSVQYSTFGSYTNGTLDVDQNQIQWHTRNNEVPGSMCNNKCGEGQIKRMRGFYSCCYDCVDCMEGFFKRTPEDETCTRCPPQTWSPARSSECYNQVLKYVSWENPFAVLLLVLISLVILLILAVAGLFLKNLHTPLIQSSGGKMCFAILLSLLVACGTSATFIGKPNKYTCAIQQPLLAFSLTTCLALFLVKLLKLVLAAELSHCPNIYLEWLHGKGCWLIVALCLLIQSAICFWYISVVPPKVETSDSESEHEILLHCSTQSLVEFGLLLSLNGGLACICFLCTFLVHTPSGKYNLARGITRALLLYFIAWIFFIPTYSTVQDSYKPVVQVSVILLCTQGILGAFFLPKCYLLWFRPERNTSAFFGSTTDEPTSIKAPREQQSNNK